MMKFTLNFRTPQLVPANCPDDHLKLDLQQQLKQQMVDGQEALDAGLVLLHEKKAPAILTVKDSLQEMCKAFMLIFKEESTADSWLKLAEKAGYSKQEIRCLKNLQNLSDEAPPVSLEPWIWQYVSLFQKWKRQLKHLIRKTLATDTQIRERRQQFLKNVTLFRNILMVLLVMGIELTWSYHHKAPSRVYAEQAQFYWQSPELPWAEANSFPFSFTVNGEFQKIRQVLKNEVAVTHFRFDPVPGKVTLIELKSLDLLASSDNSMIKYVFDQNTESWQCVHCTIEKTADSWLIYVNEADPFLTSPEFPLQKIQVIDIQFRVLDRISAKIWLGLE
ncbi:MAG: hypothetical protein HQM11_08525 [SAR324 cluster bacterium]|nr:hypothetical protein [SAR324 cluster bacterium]